MPRCVEKQPIRSFGGRGVLLGATATNQIPIHQPSVIAFIERPPAVTQAGALATAQRPLLFFYVCYFLAHVKTVRRPPDFAIWSWVPVLSRQDKCPTLPQHTSSCWWSLQSGVIIRLISTPKSTFSPVSVLQIPPLSSRFAPSPLLGNQLAPLLISPHRYDKS